MTDKAAIEAELDAILKLTGNIESELNVLDRRVWRIQELLTEPEEPDVPIPPDSNVVFRNSVLIGNPNKNRWPGDSVINCFACGPRDLQEYNGRIYGGGGDHTGGGGTPGNMGPVPVFSFSLTAGINGGFTEEIVLIEEIVDQLMVYGDTLWIPGTDSQVRHSFVYEKYGVMWKTLPPILNSLHTGSLTVMEGDLYVLTSYGAGVSNKLLGYRPFNANHWKELDRAEGDYRTIGGVTFESVIDLDDSILIFGQTKKPEEAKGKACVYGYVDGERHIAITTPFPNAPPGYSSRVSRLTHYGDGLLYGDMISSPATWLSPSNQTLYCLDSNLNVNAAWQASGDEFLRDIVVRGDTVFIMTVIAGRGRLDGTTEFQSCIWRSTDLSEWSIVADCIFPALPYSFEILEDTFFVALGSRGKGMGTPHRPGYADVASGNIYRLAE